MPISGQMTYDPSQLSGLFPMGNVSGGGGSNTFGPLGIGLGTGSLGGTSSPFTPSPVSSGVMPPLTQPGGGGGSFDSPYSTSGATASLAGLAPGTPESGSKGGGLGDLATSLQHTYYGGLGTAIAQLLQQGAGYSPQVAQSLIAAMQPQIEQGQASLMEQFGSSGTAASSSAQLGLSNYLAGTNLEVGQLLSGLYEQSIQNYMQLLTGGTAGQGTDFGQKLVSQLVGQMGGMSQAAAYGLK